MNRKIVVGTKVSTVIDGGGGSSGDGPDIISFKAGTLQDSAPTDTVAVYLPKMTRDILNEMMAFDWGGVLPADTSNLSWYQIVIKKPSIDPNQGPYEWVSVGDPVLPGQFTENKGKKAYYGKVGIKLSQVPAIVENWDIICCPFNKADPPQPKLDPITNKPTGSVITLPTLDPATAFTFVAPTQPSPSDWHIDTPLLQHDDQTGKNVESIPFVVTQNSSDTTLYAVYMARSATAPSDPAQYEFVGQNEQAATGDTTIWINVDREDSSVSYWAKISAANQNFLPAVKFAGPAKQIVVDPITIPSQVTNFSVVAVPTYNGGVLTGKLKYVFNKPSGTSTADLEFYYAKISRRQTDSSFNPLPGDDGNWSKVWDPTDTETQRDAWVWLNAVSYWQFKSESVSRAGKINTTNPPIYNLSMVASSGIDARAFNIATFEGTEFYYDPTSGKFSFKSIPLSKATQFSSQFTIDPTSKLLKIQAIDAGLILTGRLQVGGGGNKASVAKFFDTLGAVYAWIGDDTFNSVTNPDGTGLVGAWFKRILVGGTTPANAQAGTDVNGNAFFNGSLGVGVTISAGSILSGGTIQGVSLVLNKNQTLTTIDNVYEGSYYAGLKIRDQHSGVASQQFFTTVSPAGITVWTPAGPAGDQALANLSAPGLIGGRLTLFTPDGGNTNIVMNVSSGQSSFTMVENTVQVCRIRNGVMTISGGIISQSGIGATGFNPIYGGVQLTGDNHDIQCQAFIPANYFGPGVPSQDKFLICGFVKTLGGPQLRFLKVRGGVINDIWDGNGGLFTI